MSEKRKEDEGGVVTKLEIEKGSVLSEDYTEH